MAAVGTAAVPEPAVAAVPGSQVPEHAEVCYKAVAVRDGRMLSIFDGVTEYRLDELTHKSSGLWACPSLAALEHGQKFHCSQRPPRWLECPYSAHADATR